MEKMKRHPLLRRFIADRPQMPYGPMMTVPGEWGWEAKLGDKVMLHGVVSAVFDDGTTHVRLMKMPGPQGGRERNPGEGKEKENYVTPRYMSAPG